MKTLRPCLRCGRDNGPSEESCTACSAPLSAWASEADRAPVRGSVLAGGGSRWILALFGLAALVLAGWLLLRDDGGEAEPTGPSWRRPDSIAAWAAKRLEQRGAPAERARALVETRTSTPRRLLLSAHAPEQQPDALVRAAAQVLLAARDEGERMLIHAALLEHGPEDARRLVLVPTSAAASLLADETRLRRHALSGTPGRLAALDAAAAWRATEAVAPPEPAQAEPEPDGETPEEPSPSDTEPEVVDGGEPIDAPPPEAERPAHVGISAPPPAVTPARSRVQEPAPGELGAPLVREPRTTSLAGNARPGPVMLRKGPGKALSHSYEAGERGVVLLRVTLQTRTRRPLILRQLTVEAAGQLDDVVGIDFVSLVHDRDGNGRKDDRDPQLGDVVSFGDDNGTATFEDLEFSFGADGQRPNLLLLVDFGTGNEGGSVMLRIPKRDGVLIEEVATGAMVPIQGAPLNGQMTTLNGDLEPDPFQAELDRLAAEED